MRLTVATLAFALFLFEPLTHAQSNQAAHFYTLSRTAKESASPPIIAASSVGVLTITLQVLPLDFGRAIDVNDRGEIAVNGCVAGSCGAYVWNSESGLRPIAVSPVGVGAFARGMNDRGEVVGDYYGDSSSGNDARGFIWSARMGMRDLGLYSPRSINKHGDTVGFCWEPFSWCADIDGMRRTFSALCDGCAIPQLFAINDKGEITGASEVVFFGRFRPFVWTEREGYTWPDAPFDDNIYLLSINRRSEAAGARFGCLFIADYGCGDAYSTVLRWTRKEGWASGLVDPYLWTFAYDMNDKGIMVGAKRPSGEYPVMWRADNLTPIDLPTLNGATGEALAVNDKRTIVGWTRVPPDGFERPAVWTISNN